MSRIMRTRTVAHPDGAPASSPDGPPGSGPASETTIVSAVRRPAVVAVALAVRRPAAVAAALVGGAALVGLGSRWGLWYLPFVAGLAIGVLTRVRRTRTRVATWSAVAVAIGGWGAPLLWRAAVGEPVGGTARTVAALAGLPPLAEVTITATLLVALLQAFLGIWLGRSTARALTINPATRAPSPVPRPSLASGRATPAADSADSSPAR